MLVNDLSEQFDISRVTIRKDLQQLEDEGIAKRIYGGAVLADCALPSSLSNVNDRTRIALAERACEEIQDGDSIFLGYPDKPAAIWPSFLSAFMACRS